MNSLSFHANGKLLLSGEYFVLDGAEAIGLPCRFGQTLSINPHHSNDFIFWKSKTNEGNVWFECVFKKSDISTLKTSDPKTSKVLQNILLQAQSLNAAFLKSKTSLAVETHLEFPRLWGLGSSSTLIYAIAKWAAVNPFTLSNLTLGGSGYDIACAGVDHPILYQKKNNQSTFQKVTFDPIFKENLFFVYLSKKQNSREGIKRYREKTRNNQEKIDLISSLSHDFLNAKNLGDFQKVILEQEKIVSKTIEIPRAQDLYFSDFDGVIKSLGAWGGDFVLATTTLSKEKARAYFNKKGYEVFLSYKEMVK